MFSSNCSPGLHFWQICRNFLAKKSETFLLKIGKYWKVLYFIQNIFPTICSPGHPVCIFEKLDRNFPTKVGYFFAGKVGKSRKENSFCQKPKSKRSSADVNCSSENPAKVFLSEVLKSFAQSLENEINTYRFPKKRFLPNCSTAVVAVWQPYQNLSGKSWFVLCWNCKSFEKDVFFSKTPQKILLESLNSVLINLLDSLPRVRTFFAQNLKNGEKAYVLFSPKSYSKSSLGHVEFLFDNPDEVFLPRNRNVLLSMNENDEKFNPFEKFFSSKLSSGHLNIRYENPTEMFLPEVAKLLLELRNWIRIYVFNKFFSQTLPLKGKMQIRQPYWNISIKAFKQFGSKSKID